MIKTREKLILGCEELSVRKGRGFYHLSMEELALEAGVSKRTIYRYFDSKEALIEATIDHVLNQIMAKNMELVNTQKDIKLTIMEILRNAAYLVNEQVMRDLKAYYPLLWQKIDKLRQSKIELLINTLLTNEQVKMRWRVDPRIFKASFAAAMTAVLTPHYILDNNMTFEEAGSNFIEMFLFGAVEVIQEEESANFSEED